MHLISSICAHVSHEICQYQVHFSSSFCFSFIKCSNQTRCRKTMKPSNCVAKTTFFLRLMKETKTMRSVYFGKKDDAFCAEVNEQSRLS